MLSRHACPSSLPKNISALATRAARTQKPHRYHPRHAYHSPALLHFSTPESALGLRKSLPPDSHPEPGNNEPPETPDQEWEIRTGRAIYVIQETLPTFFTTGLVTSIDKATGSPRASAHLTTPLEWQTYSEDVESIYSPTVRLAYTPPVQLPTPFPRTLHIEGLPLYLTSSAFVRHTMNALYADLSVALTKVVVNTPPRSGSGSDAPLGAGTLKEGRSKPRISREKSLLVRMVVNGTSRVSGSSGEWEIEATYHFSPLTGLIQTHIVDSIHPAPHHAVYDSLWKMLGLGWEAEGGRNVAGPGVGTAVGCGAGVVVGKGAGVGAGFREGKDVGKGKKRE